MVYCINQPREKWFHPPICLTGCKGGAMGGGWVSDGKRSERKQKKEQKENMEIER